MDEFHDARGYMPAVRSRDDASGFDKDPDWPAAAKHDERRQAVAVTLAYSFDAWCLMKLAQTLGTPKDVAEFEEKSNRYRNLWNPETGFFHPKDKDGNWIPIKDYRLAGGQGGGGMSAFAVFSMMGFYPVTPGVPEYVWGSPVFSRVRIHLANGRTFTVEAPAATEDAKYVNSIVLDGRSVDVCTPLRHESILAGATARLEMSSRPKRVSSDDVKAGSVSRRPGIPDRAVGHFLHGGT